MSAQKNGFSGNRKLIWIGVGVAAAAAVLASVYFDVPPSSDTSGTIAPAQRFRAPQPGASDVNGGASTDTAPAAQFGLTGDDARSNDARSNDARSNDARSNDARSNDARSNDARSNDTPNNN